MDVGQFRRRQRREKMDGDDWILLPRMCSSGRRGPAPRLRTPKFTSVGGQTAGGPKDALGDSTDRWVTVVLYINQRRTDSAL